MAITKTVTGVSYSVEAKLPVPEWVMDGVLERSVTSKIEAIKYLRVRFEAIYCHPMPLRDAMDIVKDCMEFHGVKGE